MPKLKKPLPKLAMEHLQLRIRDHRVSAEDLAEPQEWMDTNPDVPEGKWFRRFKSGAMVAGNGEMTSTFLERGWPVKGKEVK